MTNDITIEEAIKSWNMGFDVIGDGDTHSHNFSTECNHCGKSFISKELEIHCSKCKEGFERS